MGKGFEDLEVYQEARVLRRRVFKLTDLLPEKERYVLYPQMRKAALSVTNCIAEGHGSGTYKHNVSYLRRSRGSVCELQDDFNTCEDEQYFEKKHLDDIRAQAVTVLKLINGYMKHLTSRASEEQSERPGAIRASQPGNQSTS